MKKRITCCVMSVICFLICILIGKFFSNNQFIRGFLGDIIIILLIYFFIKSFYDFSSAKLIFFILLLAYTVEFLQYLNIISILGLEQNIFALLILSAVFDPLDLIAYTLGAVTVYVLDIKLESL